MLEVLVGAALFTSIGYILGHRMLTRLECDGPREVHDSGTAIAFLYIPVSGGERDVKMICLQDLVQMLPAFKPLEMTFSTS